MTYPNPRAVHEFLNGQSLGRVRTEQLLDQILSVLRHLAPLRVRELVLTVAYSALHAGRYGHAMVAVEWREPT